MKIHKGIDNLLPEKRVVVLGNFDGLHLGHQKLIAAAKKIAAKKKVPLTVFTFYPQWQELNRPGFRYLLSQEDKLSYLQEMGVDEVICQPCDEQFASIEPLVFIEKVLLEKLDACAVVVGFNYTFGHKAAGTPELLEEILKKNDVYLHVEPPFEYEDNIVSSSLIRKQVKAGNMRLANELLGYPYHLCGTVVPGAQNGRKMNFPTANIDYDTSLLLPSLGVYAARAWLVDAPEKKYQGVLNIGTRPTVDDSKKITIEMHMLDFSQDIYGQDLCIEVDHFLRHISKFKNLSELKLTISKDVENAKKFFIAHDWDL
ncbi:MAG: riboflavin biosynthesis protein RibF [Peptococcaceae bacterium]|nr:riboflavin biosynthesis protein RibF [Peptococcaceae bacterium]